MSVAVWLDGAVVLSLLTKKANKIMTHQQMVKKMLKNPAVKVEVHKLNREEFKILDDLLPRSKRDCFKRKSREKKLPPQLLNNKLRVAKKIDIHT